MQYLKMDFLVVNMLIYDCNCTFTGVEFRLQCDILAYSGKYHRYHAPCRFTRDNKTSRQHDFMSCREGLVIRDLTIRRDLRKTNEE